MLSRNTFYSILWMRCQPGRFTFVLAAHPVFQEPFGCPLRYSYTSLFAPQRIFLTYCFKHVTRQIVSGSGWPSRTIRGASPAVPYGGSGRVLKTTQTPALACLGGEVCARSRPPPAS